MNVLIENEKRDSRLVPALCAEELTFPSWKAYQAEKIIKENVKALFSTAKSCVLPVYKRYASISFNLKKSNFSVTTYYSVKNYSNSPYKVGKFNVKY